MDTTDKYILKNKKAVECHDLMEWAEWFETADKVVKRESIGGYQISTIFLGLDHGWTKTGPPILFETMVFKRGNDGKIDYSELDMERYSTWEEAEKGHKKMVKKFKNK